MVDSIGVATLGRIALVVAMSAGLIPTLAAEQHSGEAFTRKADATCWVIGRLRSEATDHQEQSKRFGVLARSESSRADALETSLIQLLSRLEPGSTSFRLVDHPTRCRSMRGSKPPSARPCNGSTGMTPPQSSAMRSPITPCPVPASCSGATGRSTDWAFLLLPPNLLLQPLLTLQLHRP
jgi:hypothetical protein